MLLLLLTTGWSLSIDIGLGLILTILPELLVPIAAVLPILPILLLLLWLLLVSLYKPLLAVGVMGAVSAARASSVDDGGAVDRCAGGAGGA